MYIYFCFCHQNGWMPHNLIITERHLSLWLNTISCIFPSVKWARFLPVSLAVWTEEQAGGDKIWRSMTFATLFTLLFMLLSKFFPLSPLSIHGPQSTLTHLPRDVQNAHWKESLKCFIFRCIAVFAPSGAKIVITPREGDTMSLAFNNLLSER